MPGPVGGVYATTRTVPGFSRKAAATCEKRERSSGLNRSDPAGNSNVATVTPTGGRFVSAFAATTGGGGGMTGISGGGTGNPAAATVGRLDTGAGTGAPPNRGGGG